jgi:hypothetical protein
LRNCSLDERGEKAATIKLILNTKPLGDVKFPRPLRVDLAVEIEIAPPEGHITRNYEEGETYPKEECVHGEEGAVVKEDASPANNGRDDAEGSGDSGDDKFAAVSYSDDVGMLPDVKPSAKHKCCACERIGGKLKRWEPRRKKR